MKKFLFLCLFFLIYTTVFSQKNKHTLSFKNVNYNIVLKKIETVYKVKFSYASDLISNKKITLQKKNRSLSEILFDLSYQSNVMFNELDGNYIYLSKKSANVLNEVIVSSYLTEGITKNRNVTFKINPKKLDLLAGLTETDILESIQQLPGIVSIDETATGLTVRGGNSDQNRIIWDGINIYHSGHLFGLVSVFNPNIADNIDFYNKGTNAKFGERVSSVIDITTSKKINNKTKFEIGFNGINADAVLKLPLLKDKLSVQTSFRRSYEDFVESFTFKQFEQKAFQNTTVEEELFYFNDFNLKLNYKLNSKNNIHFSLINIYNELESDYTNQTNNTSSFDKLETINIGYNLDWDYKWSNKTEQRTNISVSKYNLKYSLLTKQEDVFLSEFIKKNTITDISFLTETNHKINTKSAFTLGYQISMKDIAFLIQEQKDVLFILDNNNSIINNNAVFSGFTYNDQKSFDIYAGLRVNHYSLLNKLKFEPRLIINKKLNKNVKLQFTGEIKNQIVSKIEETVASDLALERKLWRLADNDKHPIINSFQISNGLTYTKNKWTVDVDFYIKQVKGISTLSLGFLNQGDREFHVGKQEVFGMDFYVKKNFNKIETWISYSFIDAKNKYDGLNNNRYFTSSNEIKHHLTTSVNYKYNQFQFALSWKFRSGRPITELDDDFGDFDNDDDFFNGINTERLPFYHRLDLSSTYKFSFSKKGKTKGKIGFSIRNIYNNKNHINTELLGSNTENDPIRIIENHAIGITPNILFRVYW